MDKYFLLLLSALLFSGEFIFLKLYEEKNGSSYTSALCFSLGSSIVGLPLLLICNGFSLGFSWFSLMMAAILALVCVGANIWGVKAVSLGSVAVYTLFLMLGGMIIPFLVGGIFLNEQVKIWYIIATVLLTGALVLPVFDKSEKTDKKGKFVTFLLLCLLLFLLNGINSAIGKLHQVGGDIGEDIVGTVDFLIWKYIFKILICGILFLFHKEKSKTTVLVSKSSLWTNSGFAVVHIVATLLQLYCAISVNASMMYPLVTGGTLIFTPILSRMLFKEKISRWTFTGIVVSVVATVLFVF